MLSLHSENSTADIIMGLCRTACRAIPCVIALAFLSTGCLYRGGRTVRQSSFKEGTLRTKRLPASKPGLPDAVVDTANEGGTVASDRYTVRRGDTLAALSRRFYGDSKFWKAIYQANRDVIKSPNALEPGTQIRLP